MNDLMKLDIQMTSLELAELTGKRHADLMRDIRVEIDALGGEFNQRIFALVDYVDAKGEKRPCYSFGKKGAMQLALKYDAVTRYKVIEKLESLEKANIPTGSNLLALAVIEAQKMLSQKDEVITELTIENKLLAQETVQWADRKVIEALVKKLGSVIGYSEAWIEFKKELLYKHSINLNSRRTNHMNNSDKKTQPKLLSLIHEDELQSCLTTAVAICKMGNADISDIIKNLNVA